MIISSYPPLWPIILIYLVWVRYLDTSPEDGGRRSEWFRSLKAWQYFAEYYPAS
jgi:2-acylglycerol O-acyltransferase 2